MVSNRIGLLWKGPEIQSMREEIVDAVIATVEMVDVARVKCIEGGHVGRSEEEVVSAKEKKVSRNMAREIIVLMTFDIAWGGQRMGVEQTSTA